jgi:hypothetical protein
MRELSYFVLKNSGRVGVLMPNDASADA